MEAFVVLNPVAGNADADALREMLQRRFVEAGWTYEVYETTGEESIAAVVGARQERDFDVCVAIGGDGTVSGVAGGLAHTGVPMGIIPAGTGNTLARVLSVPLDVAEAFELLVGEHAVRAIDAIRSEDRGLFVLNLSVGISAGAMKDTGRKSKRRFGRLAYLWTAFKKLLGFQPHYFTVEIDGEVESVGAAEVIVVNGGVFGEPYVGWGEAVKVDDGRLDVFIVRARTGFDYLRAGWNLLWGRTKHTDNVNVRPVEQGVAIDARQSVIVQADGEMIGRTPVAAEIEPAAVQVIVPG